MKTIWDSSKADRPTACHFLQPWSEQFVCTYPQNKSPPVQGLIMRCDAYSYYGRQGGGNRDVTGTLTLHSEDRDLRRDLGARRKDGSSDRRVAEERITQFLKVKGYRVT